ncbi:hypothetical protein [Tahibacter amnicola]|uniref:Uncharacterized protein n=1 Tax=Tahibacter amnicola TaxID=2976241 RepID=A0ABY6BAE9_9GAMM|nr:hypothetical protein [Tahibacter amnicola]UXI66839.1 hypothetical protein N4264_19075 [Tahibacter amnicola]
MQVALALLFVAVAMLGVIAALFVATGVVVLVNNGASEWLAAAVPATLAMLLFTVAGKLAAGLLGNSPRDPRR